MRDEICYGRVRTWHLTLRSHVSPSSLRQKLKFRENLDIRPMFDDEDATKKTQLWSPLSNGGAMNWPTWSG